MVTTRRAAGSAPSSASASATPPDMPIPAQPSISTPPRRHSPFLPTPSELLVLCGFPVLLVFGALFSVVSPQTRAAPYDPVAQAHSQDPALAPSYFARKSNVVNVLFVKIGWAWTTGAFALFVAMHPALAHPRRRLEAALRYVATTTCWYLVTQWFFGPPLIDRGFRWTGGKCEVAQAEIDAGDESIGDVFTAAACKAAGGRWQGGHDISGHVFLLVLMVGFLLQEVGWAIRGGGGSTPEERCVVMSDGAIKSASVEKKVVGRENPAAGRLGLSGKVAAGVMAVSMWMLLMTSIYFHTWFEKLTGLITSFMALAVVYLLPRFVPVYRNVIGLPGI